MSERAQVTWSKDQRAFARKQNSALFGVGIDGRENKKGSLGQWIQTGLMPDDTARLLFLFANQLYDGLKPQAALKKAQEILAAAKKKKKAEATP